MLLYTAFATRNWIFHIKYHQQATPYFTTGSMTLKLEDTKDGKVYNLLSHFIQAEKSFTLCSQQILEPSARDGSV